MFLGTRAVLKHNARTFKDMVQPMQHFKGAQLYHLGLNLILCCHVLVGELIYWVIRRLVH